MIYNAIILNDYPGNFYATWVYEGKKKIETRMNRLFSVRGDIVICCGKSNSVSEYAGLAMCIVDVYAGRNMFKSDMPFACIDWHVNRKSLLLKNWRYFPEMFEFSKLIVGGTFQGIFQIDVPDHIISNLIPQTQIKQAYPDEILNLLF